MNLIYQYWDGKVLPSARAGVENMKKYAQRIGAEYVFEENPRYFKNAPMPHYGAFRPVFDKSYDVYDKILFADTDIFCVQDLSENIFDMFDGEIGMAEEPLQPQLRNSRKRNQGQSNSFTEERFESLVKHQFNGTMIKNYKGMNKVFNSGVVLYSKQGRIKARDQFVPFNDYYNKARSAGLGGVYLTDQNYLHAMVMRDTITFQEIDSSWNVMITWDQTKNYVVDSRDQNTKMVHIQMRGADALPGWQLENIANKPVDQWGKDKQGKVFQVDPRST